MSSAVVGGISIEMINRNSAVVARCYVNFGQQ